jgi:hypothetical protein
MPMEDGRPARLEGRDARGRPSSISISSAGP